MSLHNRRNLKKLKNLRRKENKKQKLKALLQISNLNDQDNKKSCSKTESSDLGNNHNTENNLGTDEPNPKRMKRDFRDFIFPLNGQEQELGEEDNFVKGPKNALNDKQYAELKKLLKDRKKMRHERPYLELNEVGKAALITLSESERLPLPFEDFQHFIITSLLSHMGTGGPCRWIHCKKPDKLERRIFLVIDGAGLEEYLNNKGDMKVLSHFESQMEVLSPINYGGDLVSEIALVPLTKSQKQKLYTEYGSLREAFEAGDVFNSLKILFPITKKNKRVSTKNKHTIMDKFSRKELLLSPWEMVEEHYPLPLDGEAGLKFSGFMYTREDYDEVHDNSPMWAIDCEMCLTRYGNELTRICIVDEDCNIVYETLVKPYNPIINYLTEFSGITPGMLKNVTTRLDDVRAAIRAICPPDVIFVGQSLNSDLIAMKMMHPYIIDTSLIFNLSGVRRNKTKLRTLVEEFLSLRIQTPDMIGHSPIEDAIAAMKLVQAKLCHSLQWGNAILSGPRSKEESESARMLLESREAAGMARISMGTSEKLFWPQFMEHVRDAGITFGAGKNNSHSTTPQHSECQSVKASSLFSHLIRHDKNALLVAKKNNLDKWASYSGKVASSDRFLMKAFETNRAIVKCLRDETPLHGTGIAHVSLNFQQPVDALRKADKLVAKLMKVTKGNTLYSILLAGNIQNPGNGMLLIHLSRKRIPLIPQFYTKL